MMNDVEMLMQTFYIDKIFHGSDVSPNVKHHKKHNKKLSKDFGKRNGQTKKLTAFYIWTWTSVPVETFSNI